MNINKLAKTFFSSLFHKPETYPIDTNEKIEYPVYTGNDLPLKSSVEVTAKAISKYFETWGVKAELVMLKSTVRYLAYYVQFSNIGRNIMLDDPIYYGLHKLVKAPYKILADDSDFAKNSILRLCVPKNDFVPVLLKDYFHYVKEADKDQAGMKLPIFYGLDVDNLPVVRDMTITGNILMAGSTGTGKSMLAHTILNTLMYLYSPEQIKFLLIDIKRVEFLIYGGSKYLLSEVIYTPEQSLVVLENLCNRAEENQRVFVFIDTFSDISVCDRKRFEDLIQKLTKRKNTYLIIWDSRPSADVFTETLKQCFQTKIIFSTVSQIDSNVVCGTNKGSFLLGKGDAIVYTDNVYPEIRVQCPYISENEIKTLI